jgi:GPH family glycoside/pentoside/hexuronide:cation symporter
MASLSSHEQLAGAPGDRAPGDRVPWGQLVAYGMGGLIPIALFNSAGQLMGLLGNISLGLDAFWLGTIMLVPKLWDAIFDPVIGHFSDNTRTRWGRRRPYILLGGVAAAATFVAMWWVPGGDWIRQVFVSDAAFDRFRFAYILGGLLLFFTAVSVFEIPHGALGMEMSGDYHERTRLFSAKSFLGNLFALATPWFIWLAGLEFFRGPSGSLTDGMRYVSMLVAAILIPLTVWWFAALREPGFSVAKTQHRSAFWHDMKKTVRNKSFLTLVAIVFFLSMGFNFVGLFNNYIRIFYLYGGDAIAAGPLLGWGGTVWAVTALLAVFPLNWLSKRFGKSKNLMVAILLMCAAQVLKVLSYNPMYPFLDLIPTILLSSGMLMFFALASSMIGDVTDEDELLTGSRSEGSFYSVFWWFIQMGNALAGFVMGALLVMTTFDKQQNVLVDQLRGDIARIKADAEESLGRPLTSKSAQALSAGALESVLENSDKLRRHFAKRIEEHPDQAEHLGRLIAHSDAFHADAQAFTEKYTGAQPASNDLVGDADALLQKMTLLKRQTPKTLLRLRVFEISIPLALSVLSILLTLRYPLTEARCYEIKAALQRRHAELVT